MERRRPGGSPFPAASLLLSPLPYRSFFQFDQIDDSGHSIDRVLVLLMDQLDFSVEIEGFQCPVR